MDPSPTAEAQRFTELKRTSPATKIPGTLVSSRKGSRFERPRSGCPRFQIRARQNKTFAVSGDF